MNKLLVTAAIAFFATVGSAQALDVILPGYFIGGTSGGTVVSVGDPFYPQGKKVDPQAACIEAGGEPKRFIQADGKIGYRCLLSQD